jgi:hypothetical protein
MAITSDAIDNLVWGPLRATGTWPLLVRVRWCDLRPAFLPKGQVGRGYRAVARNGRVLLASDQPLAALAGRVARARFQKWHKAILPGELAEPYGVLLCVRDDDSEQEGPEYDARLVQTQAESFALAVALGGLRVLELRRSASEPRT